MCVTYNPIGKSNVYPRIAPRVDIERQATAPIFPDIQACIRFSQQPRHFIGPHPDLYLPHQKRNGHLLQIGIIRLPQPAGDMRQHACNRHGTCKEQEKQDNGCPHPEADSGAAPFSSRVFPWREGGHARGFSKRRPGKRRKSSSAEQRMMPCSRARAARWASATSLWVRPGRERRLERMAR